MKSNYYWLLSGSAVLILSGCHTDMWTQPKQHEPLQKNTMFANEAASRPLPDGVVAMGHAKSDDPFFSGRDQGKYVDSLPPKLKLMNEVVDTKQDLKKVLNWGKERFDAYCSHCHGAVGDGNGMIAQRGLILRRRPASYHSERLRKMPIGHFFEVMTKGYGVMFNQASRVSPDDRWAIAAYIRVLQKAQNVPAANLSNDERNKMDASEKPEAPHTSEQGAER